MLVFDWHFAPSKLRVEIWTCCPTKIVFTDYITLILWNIASQLLWQAPLLFQKGKKSFPSGHQAIKIERYAKGLVYNVKLSPTLFKSSWKMKQWFRENQDGKLSTRNGDSISSTLKCTLDCKSQNHEKMPIAKFLASAAVRVNRILRNSQTVHPSARFWFGPPGYCWKHKPLSLFSLVILWNQW